MENLQDTSFLRTIEQTTFAVCLTDPNREDNPIVYVNDAFCALTGYPRSELIGQNCRLLQGPDTNRAAVQAISEALATESVVATELLNYRKDGTPFYNALHIGPVYDDQGDLLYFYSTQWDVTDVHAPRADEASARQFATVLAHRLRNTFAIIRIIVKMTAREHGASDLASDINLRLDALSRAYDTTLIDAYVGTIDLRSMIDSVMKPYMDPTDCKLVCDGPPIRLNPNVISLLGLALHELAYASASAGTLKAGRGTIDVTWLADGDDKSAFLELNWRELVALDEVAIARLQKLESGLVERLLKASGGKIDLNVDETGFGTSLRIKLFSL